jgi:hypothetical protein
MCSVEEYRRRERRVINVADLAEVDIAVIRDLHRQVVEASRRGDQIP